MDAPAEPRPRRTIGELGEELLLAALGAASVTREKAEALIEDLAARGRISREEASRLLDELAPSGASGRRLTDRAAASLSGLFRDLGLATERQYAELELRVAQLEHRLRLLERDERPSSASGPDSSSS